jgi:hypothetical protein
MTDKTVRPDPATSRDVSNHRDQPKPRSKEEADVWAILERARQQVKPRIKQELQGEVVGADILNLRLKAIA